MRNLFAILLSAFLAVSALAEDKPLAWPQFRGPSGTGIAEEQKPPVELGPEKNVKWKVAIPSGMSSPVVVGDKVVLTSFDDSKLYTVAFNRADGSEAWDVNAPAEKIESYNKAYGSPAASTCATDGKHIVSYFGSCGLFCYDTNGEELWRHELPVAETLAGFGTGTSPLIVDGAVILQRDVSNNPKIIALDVNTGLALWEKSRESKSSFCTPAVWKNASGTQIVAPGYGKMIGYNLKNGDEAWFVDGMPASCCASPVAADGNLYFAAWSPGDPDDKDFKMPTFEGILKQADINQDGVLSKEESLKTPFKDLFDNYDTNKDGKVTRDEWDTLLKYTSASKNSAFALKPGGTGDITKTSVLWKQTKGLPYVSSAILYRGQYLMIKDGGLITAYDAKTGEQLYQKRLDATGGYYASPVAANGNVYFTSLDDGTITVLAGGASKPKVVSKNPPLGERTSATPAIANNTLYVRTAEHLYAFKGEQ
jgi:outer membrane protein assembly factor BamB